MTNPVSSQSGLLALTALFLRLGATAFGGPPVHIAMMEEEFVQKRKWLSADAFLDLVGITNLVPGPNSTEIAIHLGYLRGGLAGLLLAGTTFILPGFLVTLGLAWLYVEYAELPAARAILAGVAPAVIALIAAAVYRLSRAQAKHPLRMSLLLFGVIAAALSMMGVNEIISLFTVATAGAFALGIASERSAPFTMIASMLFTAQEAWAQAVNTVGAIRPSLLSVLGYFLVIGATLYGGGFVLISFLEGGVVRELGWITQTQLVDAVAAGQLTPGPVLLTATFVGYLVAGWGGACVATFAIFAPAFVYVLGLSRILPLFRRYKLLSHFLDAVNAAALGLMFAVALKLTMGMTDVIDLILLAIFLVLAITTKINSAVVLLLGAVVGWVLR